MELIDGDDLSSRIARGAIPIDEALPIAKQIADASPPSMAFHRDAQDDPPGTRTPPDDSLGRIEDAGPSERIGIEGGQALRVVGVSWYREARMQTSGLRS